MSRSLTAFFLMILVSQNACGHLPRWVTSQEPTRDEVEILLETGRAASLSPRALSASEFPDVPVRTHLRPCCAFGSELRASLFGIIPIPGYSIPNVIGIGDLGPHTYDSGIFVGVSDGRATGRFDPEHNGLIYTCRGGFIDTAHVRDNVDWAIYFAAQIGRLAIDGGEIEIPDEGGRRRVVFRALPPEILDRYGLGNVVSTLAQWLAFQASIWHEIATWYGWSAVPLFPERASAFSPEDLYSNALGIRLAAGVVAVRAASNDTSYDRTIDRWTRSALHELGAVDRKGGIGAADLVDGLWWDSARRVPDERLLLRRNIDLSRVLEPWTVGRSGRVAMAATDGDDGKGWQACEAKGDPISLVILEDLGTLMFSDFVSFRVQPDSSFSARLPTGSRAISQADFDVIVASIRDAAYKEFGPRADSPAE